MITGLRLSLALALVGWTAPLGSLSAQAAAKGDPAKGAEMFDDRCAMCHNPKGGGQGPSLDGVVGRKAASAQGFNYTAALKSSRIVWTPAELDRFLSGPGKLVPGTAMKVMLADPDERRDLISYLASHPGH